MDKQRDVNSLYIDECIGRNIPKEEIARICKAIEEKQEGYEERLAVQCSRLMNGTYLIESVKNKNSPRNVADL
jgi:hypothetical protein